MYSEFRVRVIDLVRKKTLFFRRNVEKEYFSLFLVPYLVECYFDMSHGSYDSNLGLKEFILVRDIRSRSWPNIDGTYGMYTGDRNVWDGRFFAGNQSNHQNLENSLLTNKLWCVFLRIKQKKRFIFFLKKISKWPAQKKCIFQNHQSSKKFCENFWDWSLG